MTDIEISRINSINLLKNASPHWANLTQKQIEEIYSSEVKLFSHLRTTMNQADAEKVIYLLKSKQALLEKIKERYPLIKNATLSQLDEIIVASNGQIVKRLYTKKRSGCNGNKCCNAYVGDMSNCDTAFALETAASISAAAGTTVVLSPFLGAATLSSGIGLAYAHLTLCQSTAAREYRQCQGYQ